MQDPIQRHPTRAEQLDLLTTLVADRCADLGHSAKVLDIGCGIGYVAFKLAQKCHGIDLTGVDLSADALAQAGQNLDREVIEFTAVPADLRVLQGIRLPQQHYDVAYTCLTFHDLNDTSKLAVIRWVSELLAPGGLFLIYDRIKLDSAPLFELQRSIWRRLEVHHGQAMRSAESFDAYLHDLSTDNAPARLADYLGWYSECQLDSAVIHVHGNIALLAGAKR